MPIPNLIHPVPVGIGRIRRDLTQMNPRAREPVRQLWRDGDGSGTGAEVVIDGQMNFNRGGQRNPEFKGGGVEEESTGYVLFRIHDLIAEGITTENPDGTLEFGLERGDRITRVGRRKTNYFITKFRDVASYDDRGGASLLEVTFHDRMPEAPTQT